MGDVGVGVGVESKSEGIEGERSGLGLVVYGATQISINPFNPNNQSTE